MVGARSLHSGKSADLGRSHGFFVKVRGRLINEEDPLFGLSPLSYQTFNRFRADITVDDLDTVVTAPREGIEDSPLKRGLLPLLEELFYEARGRYEDHLKGLDDTAKRKREEERTYVPTRLVEEPIADLLSVPSSESRKGAEADDSWFYLEVDQQEAKALIKDLYAQPRTRKYRYRYTSSGKPARLVKFNPEQATFYLNTDHDLVAAYGDEPRALLLLENMVTAEAVLEVYLREHGMPAHVVGELLERRDSLLRGLANEAIFSLEAIGQLLRDSASDENDLEVNLVAASRALGFVATHLGGAGEPDGIARFSDYPNGEQKITLEAKSSGGIPELDQLDFAGLREHVDSYEAQGCLLVAPKYPGESRGNCSAASQRARNERVSCWTVDQLAEVVKVAEARHIGAKEVLEIVLNKFSPADVVDAVKELLTEPCWGHPTLYVAILEALRGFEGRLTDRARQVPHIEAAVIRQPGLESASGDEIENALADLAHASQGTLQLRGNRVIVNASLDEIERRVSALTRERGEPRRGGRFRSYPRSSRRPFMNEPRAAAWATPYTTDSADGRPE